MSLTGKALGCCLVALMLLACVSAHSQVVPAQYDISNFPDSIALQPYAKYMMDSMFLSHPQLNQQTVVFATTTAHYFQDRTLDFYLLILLVLMLGFIRVINPKYFQTLWHAFQNPTLSSRSLKDKLQAASFSNFLMNIFFTISVGAYLFYLVRNFTPQRPGNLSPSLLILMLIGGMMLVYTGKYLAIRFSGWAFRVEGITEYYLFNVFLVNKVLSIILLPFIVLIAFADRAIAQPALLISLIVISILFVNRYLRSWQVFGSFFQYSKFHFFTYLCASELLPLAVLMKLLVRGLLY